MRIKKILIIIYKTHLKMLCFILPVLLATALTVVFAAHNNQSTDNAFYSENVSDYSEDIPAYSEGLDASGNIQSPRLAIIIDDFGQARSGVKEMMKINRPLTFAIMPFLAFSEQDATQAHKSGHEVIVHLPMQSTNADKSSWLGPRPIKVFAPEDEIRTIVQDSFDSIPYAVGANIHMGSKASENERVVSCVMELVKEKGLYFVDSRTSKKSVCKQVADDLGIKFTSRNVFLEHTSKAKDEIEKQLTLAGDMAIKNGYAVVIGHVGSEGGKVTAEAIRDMIPVLEQRGIKFVFVSDLFK